MYRKINYKLAKKILNRKPTDWYVPIFNKEDLLKAKEYFAEHNYKFTFDFNNLYRDLYEDSFIIVKIPIDKTNKLVSISGGGITVWGPAFKAIGILYGNFFQFLSDRLDGKASP